MELQGKLIQKLDLQTGEGKNGTWSKRSIVIETSGDYPKKVCVDVFKDDALQMIEGLQIGCQLTCALNIESREYNGKWYTNVTAWKIDVLNKVPQASESQGAVEDLSDLPF